MVYLHTPDWEVALVDIEVNIAPSTHPCQTVRTLVKCITTHWKLHLLLRTSSFGYTVTIQKSNSVADQLGKMAKKEAQSIFKDMYVQKNIQHNAGVVNFM